MSEYYDDYFTFFEEEDRQRYIRKLEQENAMLRSRLSALLKNKKTSAETYADKIEALESVNRTLTEALKKEYGVKMLTSARNNNDIRAYAKLKGVRLWMVAERMGISDNTFSRILRDELDAEEKAKILGLIDGIADESDEVTA